jgi:integrase
MSKRANNSGSIVKSQRDGWLVKLTLDDGRRLVRKPKTQTWRAANDLLRQLLAEQQRGTLGAVELTLAEWVPRWLASLSTKGRRNRTLELYEERLRIHVLPSLGRLKLRRITPAHLERLYQELLVSGNHRRGAEGSPLAPRTVLSVHGVIYGCLQSALRQRPPLVTENVAALVEKPEPRKYQARTLSLEEARTLLTAIADHQHGPFWTLLLDTGCRFGEAAAVAWSDVDLERGLVRIRRAVVRKRTAQGWRLTIQETKTESGKRVAALSPIGVAALRVQRARVAERRLGIGERWQDLGLCFPSQRGTPLREAHVNRAWHRMLRAAGLEVDGGVPLRMHGLRHSRAGLTLDNRIGTLQEVSRQLGHANTAITDQVYSGQLADALRTMADRWGQLLETREG